MSQFYKQNAPIYCLMITGGDNRIEWARIAVHRFFLQDYPNKHLIIINHNLNENVLFGKNTHLVNKNIHEYMVNKKGKTLGDLRNLSLSYVPTGAYYFIYDDDDERYPELLSGLMNVALNKNAEYVLMKNRLNFNCNTGKLWRSIDHRGMHILFGFKFGDSRDFKYLPLDRNEDKPVNDLLTNGSKTFLWDNDPKMYVRFTHNDNTSLFVRKNQNGPVLNAGYYLEFPATEEDQDYVNSFKNSYDRVCPNVLSYWKFLKP